MIRNQPLRSRGIRQVAPRHLTYVPGLLQIKIKEDVIQGLPDLSGATPATIRALKLPTKVEEPFATLRKKKAIKEVMPVFSRATRGRPLSVAPTSVAACFTTSVRDSENEDLRGINMLRLSEYPAAYPGVIAVGAINETNRRAYFSNTGTHITLTAPGENILSTLPIKASSYRDETQYAAWSGTSMATPHVTAAVALILAKSPNYGPADVAKQLQQTAVKLPAMKNRKKTREYGSGLLDLQAAVA